jgi:hypothetical protein
LEDRWRQVLPEADRISPKHLMTLEPAISVAQTDQMRSHQLQLVIPESIQASFTDAQRSWLLSVRDFVELIKAKER